MYSKLIVSSLESRALNGDQRAIAELVSRSKQGMKRARLAMERLTKRKTTIDPVNNAQTISYPLDNNLVSVIEREEFQRYGNLTAQEIANEKRGMK